jgi:drug/metabolite transporter (DMT)-like permease
MPKRVAARHRPSTVSSRRRRGIIATLALMAATLVWGSTFLVTKSSLDDLSPSSFLLWRFGVAAVVLVATGYRHVLALTEKERRTGLILGLALAAGFLLQTTGLRDTPAGVSGFLTGTAVILTPLAAAVLFGERVGRAGVGATVMAALGLAVMGLRSADLTFGAALTLAGAACFAVHISGLSSWATPGNALGLTAVSVAVAALVCGVSGAVRQELSYPSSRSSLGAVLYVALAATCLGFLVQAWAQSSMSATRAAVVMTSEPLFAALIAVAVGGETLTAVTWLGGGLVVASMFVAELGPRDCCDAQSPRIECC